MEKIEKRTNSGDGNSGYGNSGNKSSGIFCSEEGTVILFNKDSGKKWDEIDHPHFREFQMTEWIKAAGMSREEKKNNPNYKKQDGYLRVYGYQEAWSNFWKNTDEKNKQRFLNLPNFDAEIFEKITGIKV